MKKCLLLFVSVINLSAQLYAQNKSAKEYFDEGIKLIDTQQYEEALSAFKNAVAKDANYPDALYRAGWCSNELELYDDAVKYLEKAKKIDDQQSKIYFELGYAYENLSNNEQALFNYKKTVEIYPEYYDAYMKIGNIHYSAKEYQAALDNYKKYLDGDGADNFYNYRAAWCCNELEKYADAITYLERYTPETDTDNGKKYEEIAFANYQLKKFEEAIYNYNKAMTYLPNHGPALRGLGNVYYEDLEDNEQAAKYFELAIQYDEENSKECYYKLGWLYNDQEKYNEAINVLIKAIEYDAEDPGNREEIGYSYYMTEKYEDAIVQLKKAIGIDNKSKLGYYYMGLCYVGMGKKDEAMEMYNKLKPIDEEKAGKLLDKINGK